MAEVAGCSIDEAERVIPYARGLQLMLIWWARREVPCFALDAADDDDFNAVAGFEEGDEAEPWLE